MKNQTAEDYLDRLLNSVNEDPSKEEEPIFEEPVFEESLFEEPELEESVFEEPETLDPGFEDAELDAISIDDIATPMYSKRVTKSEADFLMEFEAELAGDNYDDFIKAFDEDAEKENGLPIDASFDDGEPFDIPTSAETPAFEAPENAAPVFGGSIFGESVDESPVLEDSVFDTPLFEEPAYEEPVAEATDETVSLGGIDLAALLAEANQTESEPDMGETPFMQDTPVMETAPATQDAPATLFDDISDLDALFSTEPAPAQASGSNEMGDMFANLFGDDTSSDDGGGDALDLSMLGGAPGAIDLSNLGEADLMSLLAGDEGLSDIGNMLSQDGSGQFPTDGEDAFASFAEGEMAAGFDEPAASSEKAGKDGGVKKGGLLGKLSALLSGVLGDDEDEETVIKPSSKPSAAQLSDENADILASMDAEEQGNKKKKKEKKKKEKAPKEKKPKKVKEKAPKPKKEKKPKEVDKTPPLPKGPVRMIWVMVASLMVFVILGLNLFSYSSTIAAAKICFDKQDYAEAYKKLLGVQVKEEDMLLYNQAATLATVDSELAAYYAFVENDKLQVEAFDSLICAAGRVEVNADNADIYECIGLMEILKIKVSNQLMQKYGMTYEEAIDLYQKKDRDLYTVALYEKLEALGIPFEN